MKIRQHETLRVPYGWSGQEKDLIIQLERVLTDLYRLHDDNASKMVTAVTYDAAAKKLTVTINGVASDIASVSEIKSALGAFTWGALAGR